MKKTRYLLIGGGLASSQAAKEIRKADPNAPMTLVGEEPHVPYDRPPLTKEFLRGEKPERQLYFDPQEFFQEKGIELILGVSVQRLEMAGKTAFLSNGESITFEKALLATGGRPVPLKIPGADLPGVYYMRTLDDSAAIAAEASGSLQSAGRRAVIIGGGFIGMEVAASLTQRGVQVTVIESHPHIWARFADETLARFFQDYCTGRGVTFLTSDRAVEIRGKGRPSSVVTGSGKEIPCDFVCIGIGIIPNAELAREAGLQVDNGIVVDEYLRSSHPDIYSAGDVASYLDTILGKRRRVEHWGHAEYCGQLAGQNMAGASSPYDLLTYVWSDIFDLHLEFAGDESEYEKVLLRGFLQERSFMLLYLKKSALTAYFAVNAEAREFPPLQALIRSGQNLSGREKQLQDPAVRIQEVADLSARRR